MFVWTLGRWTCHFSIGLVFWKLRLRPSFILNTKLFLFLDLDAQALDLSLQHWSCLLEAGLSTQLHSCKTCTCPQERELVEASLDFHQSSRLSTNSAKITSLEPSLCICFEFLFDHFVCFQNFKCCPMSTNPDKLSTKLPCTPRHPTAQGEPTWSLPAVSKVHSQLFVVVPSNSVCPQQASHTTCNAYALSRYPKESESY